MKQIDHLDALVNTIKTGVYSRILEYKMVNNVELAIVEYEGFQTKLVWDEMLLRWIVCSEGFWIKINR